MNEDTWWENYILDEYDHFMNGIRLGSHLKSFRTLSMSGVFQSLESGRDSKPVDQAQLGHQFWPSKSLKLNLFLSREELRSSIIHWFMAAYNRETWPGTWLDGFTVQISIHIDAAKFYLCRF